MAQAPNSTTAANASTSRATSRREEEQLSTQRDPTELVRAYLAERGQPATAQNIRSVLEQNRRAQNEGGPGLIPELRSQEAPPPDTTAPRRSGGGNTQRENPPNVNLGGNPYGDEGPNANPTAPPSRAASASPSTVAAPVRAANGDTIIVDPGTGIPGTVQSGSAGGGQDALLPLAAITAAKIAEAALNGRGASQFVGNSPMPPSGRVMDVPGTAIPAPPAPAAIPAPPATGLEAPMAKAVEGAAPVAPAIAPPPRAIEAPIGPPLPTQATGPGTVITPPNPDAGVPRVPLPPGRTGGAPEAGILDSFMKLLRGSGRIHFIR